LILQVTTRVDLALYLTEVDNTIQGSWEFSTDLFDKTSIEHWTTHYTELLERLSDNPEQDIDRVSMLSVEEYERTIYLWNATTQTFSETTLQHLIEQQVHRTPDAVAVRFESRSMTYLEVNTRANRLANYLRNSGVQPDTVVGLLAERSFEMVIGLLAILKAGGAYLPLDPSNPVQRLEYMIENSQTSIILTQRRLNHLLASTHRTVIMEDLELEEYSGDDLLPTTLPGHLAYVIYTSGSTGQPKGVMIEHRSIVNRLEWMQRQFKLTAQDKVLQKTPFSFDVSVWEFFWTWMSGAQLVIAQHDGHKDPLYLAQLINLEHITVTHFVPSMLSTFLGLVSEPCRSLRLVVCSGEALIPSLQERFFQQYTCELYNLYGPTEASVDVSFWRCSPELDYVSIGRPIDNTQLHVLDKYQYPVPVGVPGELFIGGIGVGRGYINRPELTAQRFIPDPFYPEAGNRLYKTGDLASWLADGTLLYLGRIDRQVKIRGNRIELDEITSILSKHPKIRAAVMDIYTTPAGETQLAGYIVGADVAPTILEIQQYLAEYLPDYMRPTGYVFLDHLPHTVSGKTDYAALKQFRPEPIVKSTLIVKPRNRVEEILADLWQDILKIDRVSVYDNFFDSGGHSLLATQMAFRIQERLHVNINLAAFFEAPTIDGLAQIISQIQTEGQKRPVIKRVERKSRHG
jgi:surfactin family lipopeptide synthetase A